MEFLPNQIEFEHLSKFKLTEPPNDQHSHYVLRPQRGCFTRCEFCVNLSQAESVKTDGVWGFTTECNFCVQRLIDLLGWYEHKIVPDLPISNRQKKRSRGYEGIYEALYNATSEMYPEIADEPPTDVFADRVDGED